MYDLSIMLEESNKKAEFDRKLKKNFSEFKKLEFEKRGESNAKFYGAGMCQNITGVLSIISNIEHEYYQIMHRVKTCKDKNLSNEETQKEISRSSKHFVTHVMKHLEEYKWAVNNVKAHAKELKYTPEEIKLYKQITKTK